MEPAPAGDDRRGRAAHLRLAADAGAAARRGGDRRTRLRRRSVPAGSERRAPAGLDRDPHAAGAPGLRARPGCRDHAPRARLGRGQRGGDRLDPAVRAAPPGPRRHSAHRRLRGRAGGAARRGLDRRRAAGGRRRRPRRPPDDRARLGRGRRPLARGGGRVLGGLGRPDQPLAARRPGAVRLRRLARPRPRGRRHRRALGAVACARVHSGDSRRPPPARAGYQPPALRVAVGCLPAAAIPAGAGPARAGREPGGGRARRRRGGAHRGRVRAAGGRGNRRRPSPGRGRPPRLPARRHRRRPGKPGLRGAARRA